MSQTGRDKLLALLLCFCGQLSRHMMIECWSMSKPHISNSSITTVWLSSIDSVYLFSYATGNIISGSIEDSYSLRKMISGGLISSAFLYWLISLIGYAQINSPIPYLILWILQGFVQSTVFPGSIAVLGHWFDYSNRGKVMGVFVSAASLGNALAAVIIGAIFSIGGTWPLSILLFSLFELTTGLLIFFLLKEKPDKNNEEVMMVNMINEDFQEHSGDVRKKSGIPFMQAIFIPNMINFVIAIACMKFINHGLSMWIPSFLSKKLDNKDLIGVLTGLFEIGTLFGTIVCGWVGDRIKSRPPVISLFILVSIPVLVALVFLDKTVWVYFFVVPVAGFFAGAPNSILTGAVPVDLAQNSNIDHFEAMATIAGIIDGSGGYGAGIGIFVLGNLAKVSWDYVFGFMLVIGVVAFISLFSISLNGIRVFINR